VNYPSTEYLQLPFLDLLCFNVYLESQERLEAYLARLQTLAGDRPLVLAEIGFDSLRNGEEAQARCLNWQIRTAFSAGCAGAFVFAWTDDWCRGGVPVDDWAFGVTDRHRRPKPALAAISEAFAAAPLPRSDLQWPRISVVVCSYNGAWIIRDCLEGLSRLKYPNFEVIVVDDGSTDGTGDLAEEYGFKVIRTPNRGLSSARNTGCRAATGEIVAYIDDDAYPDPHWLSYLATTFLSTSHVAVGGPNLPPPGDGMVAEGVANAPGGPVQVLLTDREAEHIPGCNMAFRRTALEAIGGFDPQFRTAGDDVDVCWRLREKGWTLGFNPAALVWHHRRNSVRAYWRQQRGYGRAEALLEKKWPEKYNGAGHLTWAGRVYGKGLMQTLGFRPGRVYHGTWGSAPYQSLYQPATGLLSALPAMPEWYLIIAILVPLSCMGALWTPMIAFAPFLGLAAGASLFQALLGGWRAQFSTPHLSAFRRLKLRVLTSFLHLLQPMARLRGRLHGGLRRWRRLRGSGTAVPVPRSGKVWTPHWTDPLQRLEDIESHLRVLDAYVHRGGDFDRWDLEVRGGMLGSARLLTLAEDQPKRAQLRRYRCWPKISPFGWAQMFLFGALSAGAWWEQAWVAGALLAVVTFLLAARTWLECGGAMAAILEATEQRAETGGR
jgi:GT2 family glycosyltransferase